MVNISDAIEHSFWFEGFGQYVSAVKFKMRVLSFDKFNLTEVDSCEAVHYSLNPNNGLFYLLKAEIINCNESEIVFRDIGDCIYLVDQEGFRYSPIKDDHLTRYSIFADSHGIDRGRNNFYIPGISRTGAFAFYLPPSDGLQYSITTNKNALVRIASEKKAITRNEQDGTININYAIDSHSWFKSTPKPNVLENDNAKRFDIRVISFEAFKGINIDYEKVERQFQQSSGSFHVLEFEIINLEKTEVWLWELYKDISIKNESGQRFNRVYDDHIYNIVGDEHKALNYFNRNTRFMPKIKGRGAVLFFLPNDDSEYYISNSCDTLTER